MFRHLAHSHIQEANCDTKPGQEDTHTAYHVISQTQSASSLTPNRHGNSQSGFRGPPRGGGRTPAPHVNVTSHRMIRAFEITIAITSSITQSQPPISDTKTSPLEHRKRGFKLTHGQDGFWDWTYLFFTRLCPYPNEEVNH